MTCYLFGIRKARSHRDCNLRFSQVVRVTPAPVYGQELTRADEATRHPKFCCVLYQDTRRPYAAAAGKELKVSLLGTLSHQR